MEQSNEKSDIHETSQECILQNDKFEQSSANSDASPDHDVQLTLTDTYRVKLGCPLGKAHPAVDKYIYSTTRPIIPPRILEKENQIRVELSRLHTVHDTLGVYQLKGRGVNGGRGWRLVAFHYPVDNSDAYDPTTRSHKHFYYTMEWYEIRSDSKRNPRLLYRHECIGAFTFRAVVNGEETRTTRLFVSMCLLGCDTYRPFHKRFVYLMGLMTLCVTRRNDHIVLDRETGQVSLWQGNDLPSYFYCMFDESFDIKQAEESLDTFLCKRSMIYDPKHLVARDTHKPPEQRAHYSATTDQVAQSERKWGLEIGTRGYNIALDQHYKAFENDNGVRSSTRIKMQRESDAEASSQPTKKSRSQECPPGPSIKKAAAKKACVSAAKQKSAVTIAVKTIASAASKKTKEPPIKKECQPKEAEVVKEASGEMSFMGNIAKLTEVLLLKALQVFYFEYITQSFIFCYI